MAPADHEKEKKEKIARLEKEVTELRQGFCVVQDYHHDLEPVSEEQDAEEIVDQKLLKPLMQEDEEFEGIWRFHDEMLIPDSRSQVPCLQMYETFVTYCSNKGRDAAERHAFDFVLMQMGVQQLPERGVWQGYRIRLDRT